ncbi:MAG: 23S rRNA (uracil(1939)-C(5))-methyltransferase RlmD [Oscillospiraceae bacterium]|jgi:23S rRNA (uracil1939-C5)-methyltransferase|nr:23S rRNA (uracil(1939)-C(5))-methyltransferase RlmD [Oscillospiraceae bacterium]
MNQTHSQGEQALDCPVAKKCGACQLQNMNYAQQLKFKQGKCVHFLGKFGRVAEIIGMNDPFHYRNKSQAAFGTTRAGQLISGIYQSSTHKIVKVNSCLLEDENADSIVVTVRGLLQSFRLSAYNEHTQTGFLRHVLIKKGFATGEIMVVLVTGTQPFPSKNAFLRALLKQHPEITTVVQNVNNQHTSLILGKTQKVLYGDGYIKDVLCGCVFRISPKSFYQINPVQTEVLYGKAIAFAGLTGKETVLDAYCGIGTIGMIAAKSAKQVIGVEVNPDAVRDAILNAKLNNTQNIRFFCGDASDFMKRAADECEHVDVVFMDPPRAGSDRRFLEALTTLSPQKIVYVSCNPETLARDLSFLVKQRYRVEKIQPVDMFPHTSHVETVVLLSHKTPDSHINVKVEFGEGEDKILLDKIAERAEAYKPKEKVTYKMIKEYIEAKYGFKVHTAYIAEVKRDLGLPMYDAPHAVEELKNPRNHPTPLQVKAIKDALKYFEIV